MQAFVLAGGRGERLRPYTDDRPKPMVEVLGRPLLAYHLQWLRTSGVTHAVLLGGYQSQVIEEYFGDGSRIGLTLTYVVEPEPLGRGGALRHGLAAVPPQGDLLIATNGDILTTQPLVPLLDYHRSHSQALATIMLTPMPSPFGVVQTDRQGRVLQFAEKPQLPYWVNAGVYVFSRAIQERLPERGDHETSTLPALARLKRLFAYRSTAFWRSVDTAKDLRELAETLPSLPFPTPI